MDVKEIQAWVDVISTVSLPILTAGGFMLRASIKKEIAKQTRPIQKDANGGWSLPDGIKVMHSVESKIDTLHSRVTAVATDVAHLKGRFDQHVEEK